MKNKSNHLKRKEITLMFCMLSFFFGTLFITKTMTGNVIVNANTSSTSVVGMLLIICGMIIGAYTIKSK